MNMSEKDTLRNLRMKVSTMMDNIRKAMIPSILKTMDSTTKNRVKANPPTIMIQRNPPRKLHNTTVTIPEIVENITKPPPSQIMISADLALPDLVLLALIIWLSLQKPQLQYQGKKTVSKVV